MINTAPPKCMVCGGLHMPEEPHSTQHSADFGQAWLVEVEYNTDEWGIEVDVSAAEHPRTLHGPFDSEAEAEAWMNAYPDDTDVFDMEVIMMNKVRP